MVPAEPDVRDRRCGAGLDLRAGLVRLHPRAVHVGLYPGLAPAVPAGIRRPETRRLRREPRSRAELFK